jgi:ppGpp synthetase/RelA/SpoT-type nucleotidyltranferase
MADSEKAFDFKAHEQAAVAAYLKRQGFYADLASVVKRIVEESLKRRDIKVHSVEARAKDPSSFGRKAAQPSGADPSRPKYPSPLDQITDLAAVRVITYFPSTRSDLDKMLSAEFDVVARSDEGAQLVEEDRFGYQSIHYLVKLASQRAHLPEYERFADTIAEIQVRTILQHAWAEIEHDIQYKSASVIPAEIRRRFMSLAGMLEIADQEFQAIQDADKRLRQEARSRVAGGQLERVEITPDALKAFLDKRLGPDGRISDFSYDWTARLLKKLGFRTLEQVDRCIRGYDGDALSRMARGSRLGQTTRFEYMLLAGMGENYIRRHVFAGESWYAGVASKHLERFKSQGVNVRGYDPSMDLAEVTAKPDLSAQSSGDIALASGFLTRDISPADNGPSETDGAVPPRSTL